MSRQKATIRPFELDPAKLEPLPVAASEALDERVADADADAAPPQRRPRFARLLGLAALGILGLLLVQAIDYVGHLIATKPLLGWPFLAFLLVVLTSGLTMVAIEIVQARRLRARDSLRASAHRLVASELHGEAAGVLVPLERSLSHDPEAARAVRRFEETRSDGLNDGETLALFEQTVLAPLDRRAYRLVLEGSRDIGLLTALSPLGLLDGLLVLWRTTMMIRQIGILYGIRLGPAATFRLLRRCARNAAIAGLADVVSHAAIEHVGAGIAAMLSARAGQGAGNALLAGRLGIEAVRQIRPLPFINEEPPRLSHLRRALFATSGKSPPMP